jgi:hypothetical protein
VAKTRVGKVPRAVRQMAVERLTPCATIGELQRNWASIGDCCIPGAISLSPASGYAARSATTATGATMRFVSPRALARSASSARDQAEATEAV